MTTTPTTIDELLAVVRSTPRLLAVGAETKPRLTAVDAAKVKMTALTGIVEYEPSEFTFTALAGTPMREIVAVLAERGQYLPFDPMLTESGATLGGTIAAGLSGPGRFRYGGVRDFILGVRFVDGQGRLLRLGGKVVKNAAGFDVPKFVVGSLGRFGVIVEATFKVFPKPEVRRTLRLPFAATEEAVRMMTEAANARWEVDALDLLPDGRTVLLRLAGPMAALKDVAEEVLRRWAGEDAPDSVWREIGEFAWAEPHSSLLKVPVTPHDVMALRSEVNGHVHISAGGNVAYVADREVAKDFKWPGMTLRGPGPLWLGLQQRPKIVEAVKQALDPQARFPSLDD
jgi:glycolate oxidase FAD binding subunit